MPHTKAWGPRKNTCSSFTHISDVASVRTYLLREVLHLQEEIVGTSLEVQLFRLHRPMQGTQGRSLVKELRSHTHMLWAKKLKTQSRSNIVTNSTKTLKMVHIEKNIGEKKRKSRHQPAQDCVCGACLSSVAARSDNFTPPRPSWPCPWEPGFLQVANRVVHGLDVLYPHS